ncbi:MAG: radical SAM protein [Candidatus Altiarchaeota archaeon]
MRVREFPEYVNLEVTNDCNLKCLMCLWHGPDSDHKRPIGYMREGLWMRVIDELALAKDEIILIASGAGEPLMHPEYLRILDYAKNKGNEKLRIRFVTNGLLLDDATSRTILELGLDEMVVSLDGFDRDSYNRIRRCGDYDRVSRNIDKLLRLKSELGYKKPNIGINVVALPEAVNNRKRIFGDWIDRVDHIKFCDYTLPDNKVLGVERKSQKRRPCHLLYQNMGISWEGWAGCCHDFRGLMPLGNVNQDSIREIWSGKDYPNVRRLHEAGRFDELPACRDCSKWMSGRLDYRVDLKNRLKVVRSPADSTTYKRLRIGDILSPRIFSRAGRVIGTLGR